MSTRADVGLVQAGLARSRAQASEWIRAGRVRSGATVIRKPSAPVTDLATLVVEPDGSEPEFASRAGRKLAEALTALAAKSPEFGQRVANAIKDPRGCLDIGASTGGFTEVLLRRGAQQVIALDVGHDQLRPELRTDPRVIVLEGINIRDVTPITLAALVAESSGVASQPSTAPGGTFHNYSTTKPPAQKPLAESRGSPQIPAFVVGDLSFISLTLVVPVVANLLPPGGLALLLVKPQFEVGRENLAKDGVVRSAEQRQQAVERVSAAASGVGLTRLAVLPSPVLGAHGNQEYFVLFERRAEAQAGVAADPSVETQLPSEIASQP